MRGGKLSGRARTVVNMLLLMVCSVLLAAPGPAAAPEVPSAGGRATVVLVVGAEGEPEYGRDFAKWADRWSAAAATASAELLVVGRDEPSNGAAMDKQRLKSILEAQCKSGSAESGAAAASDVPVGRPLWIVFIGHGTADNREAKFNLRGPDVSDVELAEWLKPCKRPLAVIDCASASAPFLSRLSGPGRVVITATRTGSENNFARFGDFFSASIADPSADLDKDGQTSLLEAFLAASHRTAEFYKQEGRLATEHALLDDNGDKLGTPGDWFQGTRATKAARDGAPLDGARASQWSLVLSSAEQAMPADARARRDAIELKVEALRGRKASMSEADYYAQLEPLLLDLARVYESAGPNPKPAAGASPGPTPAPAVNP